MPSSEKVISPGVFTNEIDQSFLPAAVSEIGAAIPTVVNSYSEYQATFGDTFLSGSDYYTYLTSLTAKQYLKHGSSLLVTRILPTGYGGASTIVSSSGTSTAANVATGSIVLKGGGLTAAGNVGFAGVKVTIGDTNFTVLDGNTSMSLFPNTDTQYWIKSGSLGTAAQSESLAHRFSNAFASSSTLNLSSSVMVSSSNTVVISVSASAGGAGYNVSASTNSPFQAYWTKTGDAITTKLPEGFAAAIGGGTDSNTTDVSFKLHTLSDGTVTNSNSKESTNNILPSGSKNNIRWEVSTKNNKKGTFTLLIRRGDDTSKRKQTLETWNNVSLDPNQNNYIGKVVGDSTFTVRGGGTSTPYLQMTGSFPNKSKYVRVEVINQTVDYLDENGNLRTDNASGSLPSTASGSFAGGSDGGTNFTHPQSFYHNISNTNTQGLNLGTAAKGKTAYEDAINLLSNEDEYDFNMLLIPGIIDNYSNHTAIVTKAIDMCEDRGDCFIVTDPVEYAGALSTATSQAETRDSNYAAMYWPWVQIQDDERGTPVWVPPSVTIGGIYAFNDKVAQPWFAPAGLNRGGIDSAIQAERKLTQSNRDDLYSSNVNPIATFPNQGVCVWGQKTLQKKSSALDRVNVRRLLIKVKKFIAASSRFLVFEQNNAATRRRFLNIVNPFLEQIQSQSGLSAFRVVMDESNNTPDTIDRNILYGQLFLQPTRTAEFVILDFTVQPTGATFPE